MRPRGSGLHATSGAVSGVPGETWSAVEQALTKGLRGLPGGSSLGRLLDEHRPQRCRELTVETILAWADAYHAATGRWPNRASGPIIEAPFPLTWSAIDTALRKGHHGLPGGISIARLLHEQRGIILRLSAEQSRARAEKALRHKAAAHERLDDTECSAHPGLGRRAPRGHGKMAGQPIRRCARRSRRGLAHDRQRVSSSAGAAWRGARR